MILNELEPEVFNEDKDLSKKMRNLEKHGILKFVSQDDYMSNTGRAFN